MLFFYLSCNTSLVSRVTRDDIRSRSCQRAVPNHGDTRKQATGRHLLSIIEKNVADAWRQGLVSRCGPWLVSAICSLLKGLNDVPGGPYGRLNNRGACELRPCVCYWSFSICGSCS